jgi:hypothetical protein
MTESNLNQALAGVSSIIARAEKNEISLTTTEATGLGIVRALLLSKANPPRPRSPPQRSADRGPPIKF